ncbi:N-acetylmuramoyl-L-alanine amidase [Natranaerovirga pectinivora]|uniref:N-acetylmuramoyl-L-alanine amidase n=1 Tax=Natranaerovirga pectinivora TaxID=682400 RepID=A0A4R3MK55_9FIRM|nr:N-acetylmuramoyl-L-alanine amidase [Natranaerovirga pectinivora]TCT12155.1 N-acetylmuramoyl-L-alanine amidase [Natranaerovirga pectinivora]
MNFKRILGFMLAILLFIQYIPTEVFANTGMFIEYNGQVHRYNSRVVRVVINDKEVQTGDMPGIIVDSRTLVPAREVFESESMGAKVDWINDTQEVLITYEDKEIRLKINSNIAHVNNQPVTLDVPAKLIRDTSKEYAKTMIPIRFVSETMGVEVDWDANEYIAILSTDSSSENNLEKEKNELDPKQESEIIDLESKEAKRPLPTPLANNPLMWIAENDNIAEILKLYNEEPMTRENYGVVKIASIEHKELHNMSQFIIKATGPISSFDKLALEDRMVIDINNAESRLASEVEYKDRYISRIRSSQFKLVPMVTRVVFDKKQSSVNFNVSLSEDRKEIRVTVLNNIVELMEIGQNDKGDFIKTTGFLAPDVNIFRLSNPDRLVIDMPNTTSGLTFKTAVVEGQYIREVRTAQFDENTTRIVLVTDGQTDFEITKENNSTMIQIQEPGYKNIKYENHIVPAITIAKPKGITMNQLKLNDIYNQKKFTIEIPGNHLALYGSGTLEVNDSRIDQLYFTLNEKGNTVLNITSNRIYAFDVIEEKDNLVIKAYLPKDKYDKIIVIDAGHGGGDPGAIRKNNGLVEKELTLKITLYLKQLMDKNPSIKAYYTRLEDTYPTLRQRTDLANEVEADLFLSIHNNAHEGTSANGLETLYCPKVINGVNTETVARIFQNSMINTLKMNSRGLKPRENIFVLNNTNMPAVLVEIGFISNEADAAKLKDEQFLKNSATSLYLAILETFQRYPTKR